MAALPISNARSPKRNIRYWIRARRAFDAYPKLGNPEGIWGLVDNAIWSAYIDLIEIKGLDSMLTSVLYLDVQIQAPMAPQIPKAFCCDSITP